MDDLMKNSTITEIAELASKHKIVPFLGAGSSVNHLGLDWDLLIKEMAQELEIAQGNNLDVAESYESAKTKKGLADFLKKKLIVSEYCEDKDIIPLIIISMGMGLVYSTNQDNVFELCAKKYARKFKNVVSLSDLGTSTPGDLLYVKYHGDLDVPESLIFSKSSYEGRIKDIDHFLNIRMRSDLLAKSFLFVGYSFRDLDIINLFEGLNAAFNKELPSSYLIAYTYTPKLEELQKKYNVKIIDPVQELGRKFDTKKSFELFISGLCKKINILKTLDPIDDIFRPPVPISQRVATKYEVESVEYKVRNLPIAEALPFFRAMFDDALIPKNLQERVCNLFLELARKCSNRKLSDDLSAAAFNLNLDLIHSINILGAVLATAQFCENIKDLDRFFPQVKGITKALNPFCAARAIEYLRKWEVKINDTFRQYISYWFNGYNNLQQKQIAYIVEQINFAWLNCPASEHPFSCLKIIDSNPHEDIREKLYDMCPKGFGKPYEE